MAANQDDIHRLSLSKDVDDRLEAADLFLDGFESLTDKYNAWLDLIRLTGDEDSDVGSKASFALTCVVPYVSDKSSAWDDLIRLTSIGDSNVINNVTSALESLFPLLSNKSNAWIDLIILTSDEDPDLRDRITSTIGSIFSSIPSQFRNETFEAIHKLIEDDDPFVRFSVSYALATSFEYLPDELKVQAWNDLCVLVDDANLDNRWCASDALSFSFQYVPDECKLEAWAIIQELLNDEDSDIRQGTSSYISSIYKTTPEESKHEVWEEMCRLTQDKNSDIVTHVSYEFSYIFPFIADNTKSKTEIYLHELSKSINPNVSASAYYSIGKICIYKASKSENESELELFLGDAIKYFEKAANEETIYNPAKFCHLFYRSFDAVIFKKTVSKKEIDMYIESAKEEIEGSESKQKLLEAIEQLAEALETAQNAKDIGIERQELLNRCSEICNYADRLMDESKDKMPAFHDLYKKSRPFFDEQIKKLIDEVKEKAEIACREAKGTPDAEDACKLYKESRKLDEKGYSEANMEIVESMVSIVKGKINKNSEYHYLLPDLAKLDTNPDLNRKLHILRDILGIVEFGFSNAEVNRELNSIKSKVDSMNLDVRQLITIIKDQSNPQEYLDTIQQTLKEIRDYMPGMKERIDEVLYQLDSSSSTTQKLAISIPIIPQLISYNVDVDAQKFVAGKINKLKKLILSKNE